VRHGLTCAAAAAVLLAQAAAAASAGPAAQPPGQFVGIRLIPGDHPRQVLTLGISPAAGESTPRPAVVSATYRLSTTSRPLSVNDCGGTLATEPGFAASPTARRAPPTRSTCRYRSGSTSSEDAGGPAITHVGLSGKVSPLQVDPVDGRPLRYTPHDFRRMFITDAILNGLPPHIAQVIAGHQDINVTLGYKAVYPDEAIQAHLAFLARRRSLRPSDEYRVPTDEEWNELPRPLRAAEGVHRDLRPSVLHALHPRARLRPLLDALA